MEQATPRAAARTIDAPVSPLNAREDLAKMGQGTGEAAALERVDLAFFVNKKGSSSVEQGHTERTEPQSNPTL